MQPTAGADPPAAADGASRWLWHSRFGSMLIEVVDGDVFVNGQRVQPHAPPPRRGGPLHGHQGLNR